MVVVLAGIVEQAGMFAERAFDNVFERLAFPLRALQQVVAVVHISEMVLVMVEFEGFGRHIGRKGVIGIRQFWQ